MNWEDLIAIARVLAAGAVSPQTGRPRRAELNRAVSTIYYAAFHTLANNNANTLIGSGSQARSDPAWELAYRTIDHRSARALPAPRHVPIPGPNQRDGSSLRQLAGKKAPSRLRAPSAKSQIPSPPVGDGDRGGHQSL